MRMMYKTKKKKYVPHFINLSLTNYSLLITNYKLLIINR